MPSLVPPVVPAGTLSRSAQPGLVAAESWLLRPWLVIDVPVEVEAYGDPAIQQWNLRSMNDLEATEWIEGWADRWRAETDAGWAVTERVSGSVLGRVSLRRIDLEQGLAEVTYWVLPRARDQGIAVAATSAVCRWALGEVGLHRIELVHSVDNHASCRVASKTGFGLEGTLRSALLHPDGWHDMHLHALVKGD